MKSEKLELELTMSKQVTHPSGSLQVIIDNLQLKLKEAEASVAASQKALQSKNVSLPIILIILLSSNSWLILL